MNIDEYVFDRFFSHRHRPRVSSGRFPINQPGKGDTPLKTIRIELPGLVIQKQDLHPVYNQYHLPPIRNTPPATEPAHPTVANIFRRCRKFQMICHKSGNAIDQSFKHV